MTGPDATGPARDWPDLPATLAARPRDARRSLPIPPVNEHPDPSGSGSHVDLTTINTTASTQLALDRHCSLCGEPMGYWVHRAKLQQMQQLVARYLSCPRELVGVHVILSCHLSASTFSWRVARVESPASMEFVASGPE